MEMLVNVYKCHVHFFSKFNDKSLVSVGNYPELELSDRVESVILVGSDQCDIPIA